MYTTYILYSSSFHRFYIGSTENITTRLILHNSKKVRSTSHYVPWELVYSENFQTRAEAYKRELQIKSYKGGNGFKKLIEGRLPPPNGGVPPGAA